MLLQHHLSFIPALSLLLMMILPSAIFSFTIHNALSVSKSRSSSLYSTLPQTFNIKITHQNKTATIPIRSDEPILQALERHNLQDTLSLPSLPQDCRRGNCLTCSGRLLCGDLSQDIKLVNDGLSPSMSQKIQKQNIVLTCSSYVKTEGVHLEIGICDDAWREVYGSSNPWEDAEGERIKTDAVAKAMRVKDEKSLNRWALRTEKSFMEVNATGDGDAGGP